MTIIISAAVQNAFVLGSESRQVRGDEKWFKGFQEKDYTNRNFRIQPGEFPKTFLIGERYGLNYSGPGFVDNWVFENDLFELQQLAARGQHNLYKLAEHFNNKLKQALNGQPFTFHLAGFVEGYPVMAECDDGELLVYKGTQKDTGMNRIAMAGMVDIIEKLCTGELVDFKHMSLKDVVDFVLLTITAGCKYLEYFTKYPEVSGGPVNILILTPKGHELLKFPAFGVNNLETRNP